MKGKLYVVATPIGNLKDISDRAKEILTTVDLIAAEDTRNTKILLNSIHSFVKMISYHKFNEVSSSKKIIEELSSGKNVALVTDAGTPCISDPGSILVKEAINNEIEVYSIPGASAILCALTLSGFNIESFSFYGFLPKENGKLREKLDDIKSDKTNIVVLYESPKRIKKLLDIINKELNDPDVCLCNEITKKFEKKYHGTSSEVKELLNNSEVSELGEYVLVINKKNLQTESYEDQSLESKIIDVMIKESINFKDAVNYIKENNKNMNKKELYAASLRLKEMLSKFNK